MPLSRYLVRNEYGLADPDLYKVADKDDPEALLEGVAMAGLVGVLRQLGDLAEFAAEMFHDLHEEVMATAARGHGLIARVQQLEAEFPSAENTLLSQTSHIPFLYNSGVDWHPSIRLDENLVTQGDMPRFVMDSYEECRGPPRLFLLDKFDVAGAGACLKRYTDPSSFKAESAEFSIKKSEGQRETRIRKIKRRGPQWRNGDTPEVYPSSHAKLHQLLLEERIETGANDPERRVKLKKRPLEGFTREDRLKSYMQKFMDTYLSDTKAVREISLDLVPVNFESYNDSCQTGLEIVEYDTFSPPQEPYYKDKAAYSSFDIPEMVKPPLKELNEVTDGRAVGIPGENYGAVIDNLSLFNKDVTKEELAADTGSKSVGSVGEYNVDDNASEIDSYVDALATLESETETDSGYRTKRDQRYRNGTKKMIDSDGSEEKQRQNPFFDYHSRGNSTISDDGSLLKKDIHIFSSSDNVSNSAEDATAKSSAIVPVNPLDDDGKSVIREAQENNIEEHIASDVTESTGKISLFKSEFTELPWISVNVGSALTKTDKERMEQTDEESKGQVVVTAVPDTDSGPPMSVGVSPVDEMADASFESSSDVSLGHTIVLEATSSHSQPEYSGDVRSTLFNETESSSASSPAKLNNDLKQPVEATSDGLTLLQKSSPSVLNFPEPVYVPCEDIDLTKITEEKSEDQPCISDVSQDHEQPKEPVAGAPYVCPPNQFDLSDYALQCLGEETNINMASMDGDDSELAEPMISVATNIDGIVEPRISIGDNIEDSFAPAVKPLCFGNSESTEQLQLDYSENIDAHSVDEFSDWTVHESTADKTYMDGDKSSNLNLVVNLSPVDSQSDEVQELLDGSVLLDGKASEARISDSRTIAYMDGLSKSVSADKVEAHLSLDAFRNLNDCNATSLDHPGSASVSSSDAHLLYDASEPLQAEEDTISFGVSTQHIPEGKNDLDLNHSVEVLDHAEKMVASAGHNCLKAENTETERSLSSVPDFTSIEHKDSLLIEDPCQTSDGGQIQSLHDQAEVDLHNPVIFGRDDGVNSDSTACDTSSIALSSADNFCETCLTEGSPEEYPQSSVECDQHLERTNSSQCDAIEDKKYVLDALADAHTKNQFTLDQKIEAQGVEITEECSNATSQPSEYVEQILPLEASGNKMCINPIFVSSLCDPLSKPFAADHKLQNTWPAMHQSPADFPSINSRRVEADASLRIENPGQTLDPSHVSPPCLFGTFPNPTHIIPGEMPPLPPLPPMQWRIGRNQQTLSSAFGGHMQNSLGTMQRSIQPETSDNAGIRSQNSLTAQHGNPFLSLSNEGTNFQQEAGYSGGDVQQPPTDFMFPTSNMFHEGFIIDQRQDNAQLVAQSQNDLPVPEFSFESLESGLNSENDTSALYEKVSQKDTAEAHEQEQFEHIFSPAEQETTVVDEQLEHSAEEEIATTSAQFEPPVAMQYGHQLSHGFVAPEAQGIWSTDENSSRKVEDVNGSLHKKIQRPRNPLIDAVVAVDKSKLRKVGEIVKPQDKPEAETREQHLPQLRKVGKRVKPEDKLETETREQHLPQLRKVGERVKPQDTVRAEERSQNFPPLRKIGERVKPQEISSSKDSVQNLPQLRKVEKRIKPQDEPKAKDDKQSFSPLKGVGGRLKPQDGPQTENRDWLEQIRNQSFNLKPPTTSRPNIQGRQTNLKVTAILEKANMIRQAMAGTDDDSDGWSDS